MRKIVTGLFMSLDGVVEADNDWQFAYFDEEVFDSIAAGWDRADAALMGRRSFEGFDTLRLEHPDSPMVAYLERVDRYVASTTLAQSSWRGSTVLRGDVYEQLSQLKQRPGKDILVPGSPTLVRWLLSHGLLDELNVSILPIIVGSGVRLFPDTSTGDLLTRVGLDLVSSKPLRSGAVEVSYAPATQSGQP